MAENLQELIDNEIENRFYYIEYPDNDVNVGLWKDKVGKIHAINDMLLSHSENVIRMIERDIKNFKKSNRKTNLRQVLLPLVESKLYELKNRNCPAPKLLDDCHATIEYLWKLTRNQ